MKEFVITEAQAETAVLVGLITPEQDERKTTEYLDELEFLAATAGAVTVKRFTQRVGGPSQVTYVGKGKLDEIRAYIAAEEDAERVMKYVDGQQYKRREVRCNDANSSSPKLGEARRGLNKSNDKGKKHIDSAPRRSNSGNAKTYKKEDWMQFLNPKGKKLKGEEPDFSEEGWAIRKPRKK